MRFLLIAFLLSLGAGASSQVLASTGPSLGAYSDSGTGAAAGGLSGSLGGSGLPVAAPILPNSPAPVITPVTPATTATTDPTAGVARGQCLPACYEDKNATAGCDVGSQCKAMEKSTGGYFSKVDKMCNLPAGTAIKFGQIESSCAVGSVNGFGYSGLFQFNEGSCPGRSNLTDPAVQAQCLCDYTAKSKAVYGKSQNGETPSAGMMYLMHQQGRACGAPLAFGGNQPAYQVLQQCGGISAQTALKRIACNMPGHTWDAATKTCGYPGAENITSQQFANAFLSKFNGIDNNNVCINDSSTGNLANASSSIMNAVTQAVANNPALAKFVNAAGGSNLLSQMIAGSGGLTSSGKPLLASVVLELLSNPDTSDNTPSPNVDSYNVDTSNGGTKDTDKVTITTNADGTKTVKVVSDNEERTYNLVAGSQLWKCGAGMYTDVMTSAELTTKMKAEMCTLVTDVPATAKTDDQ